MDLTAEEVRTAFGRLLMQVRDTATNSIEAGARGQLRSARAMRLAELARGREDAVVAAGKMAIDDALVALLTALEMSDVVVVSVGGVSMTDASAGLAGELFGDTGWISRFSQFGPTA